MRDIPSLKTLALRAVGPPGCNPEVTFGCNPTSTPQCSSNDVEENNDDDDTSANNNNNNSHLPSMDGTETPTRTTIPTISLTSRLLRRMRNPPNHLLLSQKLPRPYIGPGRPNAADVDIAHPWIMTVYSPSLCTTSTTTTVKHDDDNNNNNHAIASTTTNTTTTDGEKNNQVQSAATTTSSSYMTSFGVNNGQGEDASFLAIENGNLATETLQLFIDALVESGRAGDGKLGTHFFKEWVVAVTGQEVVVVEEKEKEMDENERKMKKDEDNVFDGGSFNGGNIKHGNGGGGGDSRPKKRLKASSVKTARVVPPILRLGALSLHNFSAGSTKTFQSMVQANVGYCLGTLDITGVHGLNDSILSDIICGGSFPHLKRLSVKNCRKLTGRGLASIIRLTNLTALDIGGCFNIFPNDVVSMIRNHPSTKHGNFEELYASGLGWTDTTVEDLVDLTTGQLCGLGIGFSPYLSGPGLILTLGKLTRTLRHLALPFVLGADDACMSALGKSLQKLAVLDIRGCNKVYSLSGMMEGRMAGGVGSTSPSNDGHLFVLARYSGISTNSLEETMRIYDCKAKLTCILDGGGTGGGIRRLQ